LCSDSTLTAALPLVSTRLRRLDPQTQERLINWGYALTDAAIRTHVDPSAAMGTLPYPATTMR
jgi:NTE family protein